MGLREAFRVGIRAFKVFLVIQLILMFLLLVVSILTSMVYSVLITSSIIILLTFVNLVMMFVNAARWYFHPKDVKRLGLKRDVKGLVRTLNNQSLDWRRRIEAAQALGDLGPDARQAIPALFETLRKQRFSGILEAVASAIGRIDQASLLGEWDRILRLDSLPSDPVGWQDYWAIRRTLISMGSSTIPRLKEGLRDKKDSVRRHTVRILGDIGPNAKEAIPDLVGALDDEKDDIKEEAAIALSKTGKEAVPFLLEELMNEKIEVKNRAIRALGGIGPNAKDAVPALIKSLKEENWGIKERAAEALGNIGADAKDSVPSLKEALKEAFESDEYKTTFRPIQLLFPLAEALGRIAPDRETILLLATRFVESPRWDEKYAILISLGEFDGSVLEPDVLEMVDIYTEITNYIEEYYHYMEDELVGYYRIPENVKKVLKKIDYHNPRIGL